MPGEGKTQVTGARSMAGCIHGHAIDTVFRHEIIVIGNGGTEPHRGHQANTNDQQIINQVLFQSHFRFDTSILGAKY